MVVMKNRVGIASEGKIMANFKFSTWKSSTNIKHELIHGIVQLWCLKLFVHSLNGTSKYYCPHFHNFIYCCSMFMSTPPYSDLIFQDATQQLRVIKRDYRYYDRYLGNDFMRARRIVDCQALASSLRLPVALISFCLVIVFLR